MRCFLFLSFLLCTLALHARPTSGYYTNPDVDELRIEIDDLKSLLHATQIELSLLDERLNKQNSKAQGNSAPIAALEKRIAGLEKTLERASNDLRTLHASVSQTLSKIQNLETDLTSHDKRLSEISKLKGTLTSISKAIGGQPTENSRPAKTYCVKAGDSLEKIARNNKISVEAIRKANNLQNDKILVGQELKLPL